MATNPMQRKANNYLLMGILGTLVVTGAIIGFLFFRLNSLQQENKAREAATKKVYVVSQDIKSGGTVSLDNNLKQVSAPNEVVPENALSIELTEKSIAKIDLKAGTILNSNMIQQSDNKMTADLRTQEYNMVILPSQISNGDYIDIRLSLSTGTDFIVVSKKKVTIPEVDGVPSANTIKIDMSESEIATMSNAIVEAYVDQGAYLYATTYVEPGLQVSATPTYIPSDTVRSLISNNPNIEMDARVKLMALLNDDVNQQIRHNVIQQSIDQYAQDRVDNIEAGIQERITKAKQERENYLQSLGGY